MDTLELKILNDLKFQIGIFTLYILKILYDIGCGIRGKIHL